MTILTDGLRTLTGKVANAMLGAALNVTGPEDARARIVASYAAARALAAYLAQQIRVQGDASVVAEVDALLAVGAIRFGDDEVTP